MSWTCADCKRSFGRTNQSHECRPSSTVDAFFAKRPAVQRAIYDRIAAHLATLDGVHVDPVEACIMWKRERSFAEVRSMKAALRLCFLLSRTIEDERITKTLRLSAHRMAYYVDIERAAQVDRTVKEWLTEAWATSPVSSEKPTKKTKPAKKRVR